MPQRRSRSHKGRSHHGGKGIDAGQTVLFRGRYLLKVTGAVQVIQISLNPLSLDARLLAVSDNFQEFRFKRVKAHMFNSAFTSLALAYTPIVPSASPTYAELCGFSEYRTGNGQFGSGNPTLVLGPAQLQANAPKWFRRGTPYDDLLETQGILHLGSGDQTFTLNANTWLLVEYEIELKAQSEAALTVQNPALTPLEQKVDDLALANSMAANPANARATESGNIVDASATTLAPRQAPLGGVSVLVRAPSTRTLGLVSQR